VRRRVRHEDDERRKIDLYREVYDSCMPASTNFVPATDRRCWKPFPEYDDDKYGDGDAAAVRAQHRHHALRRVWISRAYSLKYSAASKENMYLPSRLRRHRVEQTCRSKRMSRDGRGPVVFTRHGKMEEAMAR